MTTITKLKAALAALHKNGKHLPVDFDYHFEAMEDLRSVIAEMEAGGPPVCRVTCFNGEWRVTDYGMPVYEHPAQPKAEPVQEPVLYVNGDDLLLRQLGHPPCETQIPCALPEQRNGYYKTPLYAAAPQAKPLTDEEIAHIVDSITVYQGEYPHAIARAIEAAHGIKP